MSKIKGLLGLAFVAAVTAVPVTTAKTFGFAHPLFWLALTFFLFIVLMIWNSEGKEQ